MDNKQNQPNSGSSSSSASNKPAGTPTSAAATEGFGASTGFEQQPETTSKAAGNANPSATSSATTSETSQSQDTQRKSWLNQDELLKGVNQLPQSLKDLGNKAVGQFNGLSSTQKVVGGALLVSGLSWLALRGKKNKASSDTYAPYTPKGSKTETKWNSSSESVYRGALSKLDDKGTENGF